jgi:hypothetical protein
MSSGALWSSLGAPFRQAIILSFAIKVFPASSLGRYGLMIRVASHSHQAIPRQVNRLLGAVPSDHRLVQSAVRRHHLTDISVARIAALVSFGNFPTLVVPSIALKESPSIVCRADRRVIGAKVAQVG